MPEEHRGWKKPSIHLHARHTKASRSTAQKKIEHKLEVRKSQKEFQKLIPPTQQISESPDHRALQHASTMIAFAVTLSSCSTDSCCCKRKTMGRVLCAALGNQTQSRQQCCLTSGAMTAQIRSPMCIHRFVTNHRSRAKWSIVVLLHDLGLYLSTEQ